MSTKLENKGKSCFTVTVVAVKDDWKAAQEKAIEKLSKNVEIKGFRKGKAPRNLVLEKISKAQIFDEAVNEILPKLFTEAVTENKLEVFLKPNVNVSKISDEELEVIFDIVCTPEVKLGQYKGLGIKIKDPEVSEQDIEKSLEQLKNNNAELVLKDGAAEIGDTVIMDFDGFVDEKPFDGGSAKNYSLELGSKQFIPGFEEQLVGAKSDSEVTVNVKFPEQYVKELAGKDAKFICKIHEVKSKKIPEVTDEFAAGLGIKDVKDVKTLKEHLKADIKNQKNNQAKQDQLLDIIDAVVKSSKFELADQIIAQETEQVKNETINNMQRQGITLDQYKEIVGVDDKKMEEQFKEQAITRLQQFLVLNEIGKAEKITVTKEEIQAQYTKIAGQYGMKIEDVEKALKPQENQMISQLVNEKITKFLVENNDKK